MVGCMHACPATTGQGVSERCRSGMRPCQGQSSQNNAARGLQVHAPQAHLRKVLVHHCLALLHQHGLGANGLQKRTGQQQNTAELRRPSMMEEQASRSSASSGQPLSSNNVRTAAEHHAPQYRATTKHGKAVHPPC